MESNLQVNFSSTLCLYLFKSLYLARHSAFYFSVTSSSEGWTVKTCLELFLYIYDQKQDQLNSD